MLVKITRLFPLWALLLSVAAYFRPATFIGIGPYVAPLLMLIMFAMGVTLRLGDFKRVLSRPAPVAAATFLHYLIMPLTAWILAMLFRMPPDLSAGMVLVGSVGACRSRPRASPSTASAPRACRRSRWPRSRSSPTAPTSPSARALNPSRSTRCRAR